MAYWGEPLFGYYKLTDPWVIRRHMHLLADAGIDTLVLDASNAEIYENVLNRFLPVLMQIRAEGGRTPQVCFMLNTDMGNMADQLLEKLYQRRLARKSGTISPFAPPSGPAVLPTRTRPTRGTGSPFTPRPTVSPRIPMWPSRSTSRPRKT
jgi:hypothetical protein